MAQPKHKEDMVNELEELEILVLDEDLGESATCQGGRSGVDCPNAPEWIARAPCCGISGIVCTPCKAWMLMYAMLGGYAGLECAGCGQEPCPPPVFVRA